MIQPIVGIKLKSKRFVSLLNAKGQIAKHVFVYRDDFDGGKIPVFLCKMQTEAKIQKIFKIGQIEVPENYLQQISANADCEDAEKNLTIVKNIFTNAHIKQPVRVFIFLLSLFYI